MYTVSLSLFVQVSLKRFYEALTELQSYYRVCVCACVCACVRACVLACTCTMILSKHLKFILKDYVFRVMKLGLWLSEVIFSFCPLRIPADLLPGWFV